MALHNTKAKKTKKSHTNPQEISLLIRIKQCLSYDLEFCLK